MKALAGVALAVAGAALGVAAYRVQVHDLDSPVDRAAATVVVAWSFLAAGLVGSWRRPGNLVGPLMLAAGFALLARQLRYSEDALVFTVFFAFGDLGYAIVAHSVLAYPSGRLTGRGERVLVKAGYIVAGLFPLAILLLHDQDARLRQFDPSPRRSLVLISGHARLARVLQDSFLVGLYGVLAAVFLVLVVRKLVLATPRLRRILLPLLVTALVIAARGVFEGVFLLIPGQRPLAATTLFWWQTLALVALPIAMLAGLLRQRLARVGVGDLVVELEHTPPAGLRDALARALGDPSLELAFWLPESGEYADGAGARMELPAPRGARAVTKLENAKGPVAALVYDASLLDEPRLVEGVAAAARLSLENARLQAETQRQLAEVRESRARIVAAADGERRRIERDLHDGAQQRLVALALELRSAQRQLGESPDPALERLLASSVEELQAAVGDLRELARGVHPAVLTEEGLAAALESLAARTPLPVEVDAEEGRFSPAVEAAAYFVACEALANVVKHAGATTVSLRTARLGGVLAVEVADDGIGGAAPGGDGSGLRGLADRVEAAGGKLLVDSPPGEGTRIVAELPCAS